MSNTPLLVIPECFNRGSANARHQIVGGSAEELVAEIPAFAGMTIRWEI